MARLYQYPHIVGFEETNLVGNIYYVNHLRWQGRCREMFLRDHAPDVLTLLDKGALALVTLNVSCEYLAELSAFDEVVISMSLEEIIQRRIVLRFDYFRKSGDSLKVIARNRQEIACMTRNTTRYFLWSGNQERKS